MNEDAFPHDGSDPTGYWCGSASVRSGRPVAAVQFVLAAVDHAGRDVAGAGPGAHVRGQDLCRAVVGRAREVLGEDASRVLREWGLVTGDDVGAVVAALVRVGLLATSPEDAPDDFAGIDVLAEINRTCPGNVEPSE